MTTIKPAGRDFFPDGTTSFLQELNNLLHCRIICTGTMESKGGFVLPVLCVSDGERTPVNHSSFIHLPHPLRSIWEIAFASKLCILLLRDVKFSLKASAFQVTENGVYPTNHSRVLPGTGLRFCCYL